MREALQRSFYRYFFCKDEHLSSHKTPKYKTPTIFTSCEQYFETLTHNNYCNTANPEKAREERVVPPLTWCRGRRQEGGQHEGGNMEKYFSQKHICCSDWDANERWRLGLLQVRLLHQVRSRHPEGPLNLQQSRRCTASSLLCLHNMESSTFKYKFSTQNKTDSLMIRTNI